MDENLKYKIKNKSENEEKADLVKEIEMDDLKNAISNSIRQEIGGKDLDTLTKPAAIDWIKVVSKCIPWSREQRYQLDRIVNILVSSRKTITVSEFAEIVNTNEVNYFCN